MKKAIKFIPLITALAIGFIVYPQGNSLVNTTNSPHAKLRPVNMTDVKWTEGFWAERFDICQHTMVPHMMDMYMDDSISHGFANFEIAAGIKKGEHVGPPFHDGDFYKILEGLIMTYAMSPDEETEQKLDSIIAIIGKTQRADGYIHSPVVIEQMHNLGDKKEFADRLDFETYNMGHLMTAACLHHRLTGKSNLLDIARRATDFLYQYYIDNAAELAGNAICPSHYMGVAEMYRTTSDLRYLELAKGLIDIRRMVENGTDHNQDRIPFRQQREAVGHAVRANYLYAGAADVFLETGEDSLMNALDAIWHDLVTKKLYITGGCGALYDGVSPNGTTYDQPSIQQVHQAYGQDYQLPNLTAHNESCANIGNILWNWRMLQATADVKYADVMEMVMYNSLLSAVSLDGKGYFYTNPLAISQDLPFDLRWSKTREPYIGYCNCCPPNTIRTIAQIHNYFYNVSDEGLYINFYGGNELNTNLSDGTNIQLKQETDYPWDGTIRIKLEEMPTTAFGIHMRIPQWCDDAQLLVNGESQFIELLPGTYTSLKRKWNTGDVIELQLPMDVLMMATNPLVEENKNQVAIKRGPVVYCLESMDIPDETKLSDVLIPSDIKLEPKKENIGESTITSLSGEAGTISGSSWEGGLYREIGDQPVKPVQIKLIPYYAWGNRGKGDMTVWLPLNRK